MIIHMSMMSMQNAGRVSEIQSADFSLDHLGGSELTSMGVTDIHKMIANANSTTIIAINCYIRVDLRTYHPLFLYSLIRKNQRAASSPSATGVIFEYALLIQNLNMRMFSGSNSATLRLLL